MVKERKYNVVALQVPIAYNKWGDFTCNGMIFALENNVSKLEEIVQYFPACANNVIEHNSSKQHDSQISYIVKDVPELNDLVRPLVLRARKGELVKIHFKNKLRQPATIHLIAEGYNIYTSDGASVGCNTSTIVLPGGETDYEWKAEHEGVFPFHDMGDLNGDENGSNARGLFGAFVVEPEGATWHNPQTGDRLDDMFDEKGDFCLTDGLVVFVDPQGLAVADGRPRKVPQDDDELRSDLRCFREYVIFMHDEAPVFRKKIGDDFLLVRIKISIIQVCI
jgi:hypothetical protein